MSLLKRIFRNKFFYLAVVLEIFSMFYPHMDTHYFWQTPLYYFSSADFLYFMLMPLRHGIGNLLLPFVAALPSAIFLAQNRRSKTDLLMNYRYGRRRFVLNQILGTAGGAGSRCVAWAVSVHAACCRCIAVASKYPVCMAQSLRVTL